VAPIVIVGASLAGLRAAQAIRAAGHDGDVVVVGAESRMPYTRPPLSKELLGGEHDADRCDLDSSAVDVTWRLGVRAEALDVSAGEVRLSSGETLAYERLIVATGCRARTWAGPGAGLEGLVTLRDLDDALALREAFARGPRVAVVGAGFVGCEVAATARKLGLDVTLIDVAPAPMTPLGPGLGDRCADLHRAHGVQLRLGAGVAGFAGDARLESVELADGSSVAADVAVVALGAVPNTEWLDGSGLRLDGGGVVCDATLTAAGAGDVLCAGDVTSWPHPLAGGERIRIEHWTNAVEQGTAAGRNALLAPGDRAPFHTLPYFWSDQHGVKIQAVGLPGLAQSTTTLEATPDGDRLVAVGVRDGRVVSAVAFNAMKRLMVYRRALADPPALDDLAALVAADDHALGAAHGAPA
jgi:3-phenylpropionate/trans-cinnamate dioxygenase ferredoxin reductase subunit